MSTTYGAIKLRDGTNLAVEAFGVTGCIKLIKTGLDDNTIVISNPLEVRRLISYLEVSYDHVWKDE